MPFLARERNAFLSPNFRNPSSDFVDTCGFFSIKFFKARGRFRARKFVTTFGNRDRKFLRKGRAAASNEHRARNWQVKHFLCWAQWLLGIALASANVVICVMDETMIPWNFWGRKGNVVKVRKEDAQHVFAENIADAEACMTLVATIRNDPNVQKRLKQFLMPKGRKLKDSDEFQYAMVYKPSYFVCSFYNKSDRPA